MTKHPYTDVVCWVLVALTLLATVVFVNADQFGIAISRTEMPYVEKLFDTDTVHSIDIVVDEDDWQNLLDNALEKEYIPCSIVIDGTALKNVGIRTKGNSSLSQVTTDRYSFKVEFDHYDGAQNYYGLDKLCLNNIIQDNTYLKDYICYDMFRSIGVAAPLCSYTTLTVNGTYFGFYMAVEGIEEAFAERNFGSDYGLLYKPDSMNGQGGGMSNSDDTKLLYLGDSYDRYSHIFDNATFSITDTDKDRLIASIKQLNEGINLEDVLDIDAVIRYFVVHNFVLNGDSYTGNIIHNYYLYEDDGVLSMIPWDYNLAFGGFSSGGDATSLVNYPIDTPLLSGQMEDRPMLSWIFAEDTYLERYHQLFDEWITTYFESGAFEEMYTNTRALISPYVEADITSFTTYETYQKASESLQEFCLLRAESIRGQLDGTIPSTEEGQQEDNTALIDASAIDISSMGSHTPGSEGNLRGNARPAETFDAANDAPETQQEALESNSGFAPEVPTDAGQAAPAFHETRTELQADPLQALPIANTQSTTAPEEQQEEAMDPTGNTQGGIDPNANTPSGGNGEPGEAGGEPPDAGRQGDAGIPGGDRGGMAGNRPNGEEQVPNFSETASEHTSTQWVLLAASGVVLLFGILIACKYRR